MGSDIWKKAHKGVCAMRSRGIQCVAIALAVCMVALAYGGMATAEAATETYECPHGGFTEMESTGGQYYPNTQSGIFGTYPSYTAVFRDDFYGHGIPQTGDTLERDGIYGKEIPGAGFSYHYAYCPACQAVYRASDNGGTGYTADLFVTSSNRYNATKVLHGEDIEGYYFMKLSYDSPTGQYVVENILPLRDYAASRGYAVDTDVAEFPHSYRASHACGNAHKERLHTHKELFDGTVQEYECSCTETHRFYTESTTTASDSICGHRQEHYSAVYVCKACGEYLYREWHDGCSIARCDFYMKAEGNFGCDYYVPLAEGRGEGSHPGIHSYRKQGERFTCSGDSYLRVNEFSGNSNSTIDSWEGICDQCGATIMYYSNGKFNDKIGTSVGSYHYYYVEPTLPDSCYSFGDVHSGSVSSKAETDKYECYYGEGSMHLARLTFTYYDCRTCGQTIYEKDYDQCGYGHGQPNTQTYACIWGSSLVGPVSYWYREDEKINAKALHRTRTLACTKSEYGETICGRVVTALVPLEKEQELGPGEEVCATAYARFLDGHVEKVECAVSGLDAGLYNGWQTATLSYGEFSSVSSREPQTATVEVYIERRDFDLTLTLEDGDMGKLSGAGSYTAGTEASALVEPAPGYSFLGWYDGDREMSRDTEYLFTMPAKDLTLTARFRANSYRITVASESAAKGTASGGGTATYRTQATVVASPKPGFSFLGWYDGAKRVSSDASYTFTVPAYDLKLTAKFLGREVTVSFDPDGGSACADMKANYLSAYGKLPVPAKSGHTFLGWTYRGGYVTETSSVTADRDHTLTASWAENGPEFIMVSYGEAYKDNSYGKLPSPSKRGYGFTNWFLTENAYGNGDSLGIGGNAILPGTKVQTVGSHWLHAGWEEKQFRVSFEPNGGSPCGSITVSYDRKYGFHSPLPVPVRAGHTFTGWYVSNIGGNGDGTQVTDETRVQLLSDQTLYAGWTQDAVEVQVRFEPRTEGQVGLSAEESKALGFGSTIGVLAGGTPERTVTYPGTYGNYMLAWCSCTAEGHKDLPEYGGRHYSIDYSSAYEKLPVAARVGYTFTGWTYRGAAATAGTGTLAAFGHTLFASYTPDTYVVALDGRGAAKQTQASATMTFDMPVPKVEVPEKRGYTFLGYYTGTKGTGTQYYGADGSGMREWLEDSIGITKLYACWEQDEITVPEEGDRTDPKPEEEESIIKNIRKENADIVQIYADDYNPLTGAMTDMQPYLVCPVVSGGMVRADGAIPSTEKLSIRAKTGAWMLSYTLQKKTGIEYVRYYVTVPYRTQHEKEDESLVISGRQTKTYTFMVPKAWCYYMLADGGVFYPDSVEVSNPALADGTVTLRVAEAVADIATEPPCSIHVYGGKQAHITWKAGKDADGTPKLAIALEEEQYIISDTVGTVPDVDAYLSVVAGNAAWEDLTQFSVRSDRFTVAGITILSDAEQGNGRGLAAEEIDDSVWQPLIPDTSYEQSYASGVNLIETKENGTYASTAVIGYRADEASPSPAMLPSASVENVNPIVIHTPVACDGRIEIDGTVYGAYRASGSAHAMDEGTAVLALSGAYNEFTVFVRNEGSHRMMLGYGEKDFTTALSGSSNLALHGGTTPFLAVKFPFDVYADTGNDSRQEDGGFITAGDKFYKAGTWVVIGTLEQRFYVPMTIPTGDYVVEFMGVAVNCPTDADGNYRLSGMAQAGANKEPEKYIATDSMKLRIEGSITDVSIMGTNDPAAAKQFSSGSEALTLKKGYSFGFRVSTVGMNFMADSASVTVKPCFYYVGKDGERTAADVYYAEYFSGKGNRFVKVGSPLDVQNVHSYNNRSIYAPDGLPERTEGILSLNGFAGVVSRMFSFAEITMGPYTRMLPEMAGEFPEVYCTSDHTVYLRGEERSCGHAEFLPTRSSAGSAKAAQSWHGIYYIPDNALAVAEGTLQGFCQTCGKTRYTANGDALCPEHLTALSEVKIFSFEEYASKATITGKEEFFRKDGTLLVSFRVEASDGSGTYGFEKWMETDIAEDFMEQGFSYAAGDMVLYELGASAKDDYEVGGSE